MRYILQVVLIVLIVAVTGPTISYAYWQNGSHSGSGNWHGGGGHWHGGGYGYVGAVGFSAWPDYYAPYYYPPSDDVLVSPPVYTPVADDQQAAAPQIIAAGPASDAADAITINIPNNHGGYTAVTLKRSGTGFVGPQGEFYQDFPSVAQLKIIYGK